MIVRDLLEPRLDRVQQWQLEIMALGCLENQARVLRGQGELERRVEAAFDHHSALHLSVGKVHRSTFDRLQELRGIDAYPLSEADRPGQALDPRAQPCVTNDL